jgi:hypothetical protein
MEPSPMQAASRRHGRKPSRRRTPPAQAAQKQSNGRPLWDPRIFQDRTWSPPLSAGEQLLKRGSTAGSVAGAAATRQARGAHPVCLTPCSHGPCGIPCSRPTCPEPMDAAAAPTASRRRSHSTRLLITDGRHDLERITIDTCLGSADASDSTAPAPFGAETLAALASFAPLLRRTGGGGVERVRAVGTAALRAAPPAAAEGFLAAAREALGHPVEVLSGGLPWTRTGWPLESCRSNMFVIQGDQETVCGLLQGLPSAAPHGLFLTVCCSPLHSRPWPLSPPPQGRKKGPSPLREPPAAWTPASPAC